MPSTYLPATQSIHRGSTMMKRLCLPGISLQIEECTQCGASSGSSETLGESMAMRLAHILQIFWLFPFPFPFPRFRVFQLPVGGASELVCSAICSTCKLLRAPSFMLLIVLYNSVYYNYIIITQWLVGWFRDQGKREVALAKKAHCGPMLQPLILSLDYTHICLFMEKEPGNIRG